MQFFLPADSAPNLMLKRPRSFRRPQRRGAEPRPAEDEVATGVQLKENSPALARFLDRSFHGGYSGYSTPKITENTKGLISIHPMTIAILGARHVQTNLQDVNKNYNNQEVSRRMR